MYCELCGEYSGHYKYCKKCYEEMNEEENESDCIICGEESYGYQFCKKCYYELKDVFLEYFVSNFL